jgi:hypothetical protein
MEDDMFADSSNILTRLKYHFGHAEYIKNIVL